MGAFNYCYRSETVSCELFSLYVVVMNLEVLMELGGVTSFPSEIDLLGGKGGTTGVPTSLSNPCLELEVNYNNKIATNEIVTWLWNCHARLQTSALLLQLPLMMMQYLWCPWPRSINTPLEPSLISLLITSSSEVDQHLLSCFNTYTHS